MGVLFCFVEIRVPHVAHIGLKILVLLPRPPECGDYRCVTPGPARVPSFCLGIVVWYFDVISTHTQTYTLTTWQISVQTNTKDIQGEVETETKTKKYRVNYKSMWVCSCVITERTHVTFLAVINRYGIDWAGKEGGYSWSFMVPKKKSTGLWTILIFF